MCATTLFQHHSEWQDNTQSGIETDVKENSSLSSQAIIPALSEGLKETAINLRDEI
jgi:hypothetical protein